MEVVEDISHERLRTMLREEGVSFQRIKTWKESTDPDYETKKERVLDLYALADGKRERRPGDPDEIICLDEFGPLNLRPHPGRQWACRGGRGHVRRRRRRATFHRLHGIRHLFAAYDLRADRLYGHIKPRKRRGEFLAFLRYVRSLYPEHTRLAIILDNFSPHLTTKTDRSVGDYADAHNIELVYVPYNASWLNRIEAQFTGLRYFALDGTDHATHKSKAAPSAATLAGTTDTHTIAAYAGSSTGRTLLDAALDRQIAAVAGRVGVAAIRQRLDLPARAPRQAVNSPERDRRHRMRRGRFSSPPRTRALRYFPGSLRGGAFPVRRDGELSGRRVTVAIGGALAAGVRVRRAVVVDRGAADDRDGDVRCG
jgi:hypothetical protein